MIQSKEYKFYQLGINIVLIFITLCMFLPILLIFSSSLTSENMLINSGYSFWPQEFSLSAYQYIWQNSATIFRAYGVTILVTVIGTAIHLLLAVMMAFALSMPNLPFRKIINFYVFFTMLFSGGLVPSYIMWTQTFHVKNTLMGLLLPGLLLSAMDIILIRTYFMTSIPSALYESAEIDGAGYFQILRHITLPLGKPILVTIGLFSCLGYWNNWTNGLYYITDSKLFTIQVLLNKMIQNIQALQSSADAAANAMQVPQVSIRMAIAFVALLPILLIYPFLQKYFAKGIMLGAVKG